ncbi:hypothetical protein ACNO7K_11230, partial [Bisgaard Taxon 45]
GRVVEGTGLENRRGFTPSVSSNLTSSAINIDEQIIAPLIEKSVAFFIARLCLAIKTIRFAYGAEKLKR